ncbi:hypothetical protein B296_00054100 [Ensete ventricosum]|uniref:Uncharacterized protein n=1 Tax=Ensete ventricosum TaxID=4639 RepID=A0A426XUC4_ENSVE|nr:hypothetical protein B296_00054100 [Ensete ventricosum]
MAASSLLLLSLALSLAASAISPFLLCFNLSTASTAPRCKPLLHPPCRHSYLLALVANRRWMLPSPYPLPLHPVAFSSISSCTILPSPQSQQPALIAATISVVPFSVGSVICYPRCCWETSAGASNA